MCRRNHKKQPRLKLQADGKQDGPGMTLGSRVASAFQASESITPAGQQMVMSDDVLS